MARVIVVTSGKGGVGKSTLTASIGRVLAARGYKVALVDADFGLNNLDVLLGVESKVVYDVVDVAENRCRALQALVNADENGLRLLAAAHTYDESRVDGQSLKVIVNSLSPRFDFIFIDSPAGIEKGFRRAVCAATEAIVVTHAAPFRASRRRQNARTRCRLRDKKARNRRQPRSRRYEHFGRERERGRNRSRARSGNRGRDSRRRRDKFIKRSVLTAQKAVGRGESVIAYRRAYRHR